MAKFDELSKNEKIVYIKEEFIKSIEELMLDPAKLKTEIPDDKFKIVMDYIPTLKVADCTCGSCLSIEKLEGRIPVELQPLIDIAGKRCGERVY